MYRYTELVVLNIRTFNSTCGLQEGFGNLLQKCGSVIVQRFDRVPIKDGYRFHTDQIDIVQSFLC